MKIIRKNPNETSIQWRRIQKYSGILEVISSITYRMKVSFSKSKINKQARGVFKDYGLLVHIFSRFNFEAQNRKWGRRESRRYFYSYAKQILSSPDSKRIGDINIDFGKYRCIKIHKQTEILIANKDLNKMIKVYSSSVNFIDKLSSFSIHNCKKFIDLTKEFLCDPTFLKFAYYLLKKDKEAGLEAINNE